MPKLHEPSPDEYGIRTFPLERPVFHEAARNSARGDRHGMGRRAHDAYGIARGSSVEPGLLLPDRRGPYRSPYDSLILCLMCLLEVPGERD